ncbi:MAG: hypothetical protein CBB79_05630 [Synechococcus sp. TMED19]|nr:MAG: hypothetical protein CBB79_05630 [Synechococcus sp. TMED19]
MLWPWLGCDSESRRLCRADGPCTRCLAQCFATVQPVESDLPDLDDPLVEQLERELHLHLPWLSR